ncbi:2-amino-4-hydroxy-6-hydroxymethyldihydropteridine diphosphokinase [Pseudidiomarina insulisalsae]|uniref:2-amino-4-hydroxy-6-hydroxymethyldihydropteridine pyrophosphokinase n=1 Tax=Pseudidiomarina insulisalsae TaxID=575789 RepID=A0A432YAB1_9GAMM|nr:2-amino-4-hydroxy-6-hydroxymethyldihydropteridine diphosphokinase [Pseudidiomarina insulisalsae]RUO57806.1 2-amino-4-hydroxy-6-hydroxymethyldihydropteridine diphosphokinase [Pseudidiomarina insulisalsae]
MKTVFIALGANLGEPVATLTQLLQQLRDDPHLAQVECSSFYRSKPMGPQDQPDYVNAVLRAQTSLAPLDLLDHLQALEKQFGRVRNRRWGERTLDLDLLLFAELELALPRLTIPHPGLSQRDFVLVPLAEIANDLVLPNGRQVKQLVADLPNHDLVKIT